MTVLCNKEFYKFNVYMYYKQVTVYMLNAFTTARVRVFYIIQTPEEYDNSMI